MVSARAAPRVRPRPRLSPAVRVRARSTRQPPGRRGLPGPARGDDGRVDLRPRGKVVGAMAGKTPVALETLWAALRDVVDPEIPAVNVVEMGMVHRVEAGEDGRVTVEILPTFTGCPALDLIGRHVRDRLEQEP